MKYAYLSVLFLVLVSGCTGLPGGIFGADVISLQKTVVREDPKDIVVVPTILTLPSPPLLPNQDVILSMVLENKDELSAAQNVRVDLFNAPTFKDRNNNLCNLQGSVCYDPARNENFDCITLETVGRCVPDQCSLLSPCSLLPGEQKQLHFFLRAPSEQEIANIRTETELDIKTLYEFDGSLVLIVPVVNVDEVIRLQTEGKKLSVEESKLQGSGPLVIDTEVVGAQYILSSSYDPAKQAQTLPQKSIIRFIVKNTGSGSVVNNIIPKWTGTPLSFAPQGELLQVPGAMRKGIAILFPPELVIPSNTVPSNFYCSPAAAGTLCVNNQDIQIFRDESRVSMRFELLPKPLTPGTPFRSSTIKAYVWYEYELRNKVSVSINPFQNV